MATAPVLVIGAVAAWFSALETAIGSLDSETRLRLRKASPKPARILHVLLQDRRTVTNSLLLAGTLLNTLLLVIALLGLHWVVPLFFPVSWWLAALLLLGVIALFEILPKVIVLHHPVRFLALSISPARHFLTGIFPFVRRLQKIGDQFAETFRPAKNPEELRKELREELLNTLEIAGQENTLRPEEAAVLRKVLKLGEESATYCMTPRVDTFFLPDDLDQETALQHLRKERFRIVPVCGESPDDVLGTLDAQTTLLRPDAPYLETLQPPAFIPDSMNALALLQSFLTKTNQRFAILLDEYGGIEGIVTLSDLLDEILGEEGPDVKSGLYFESLGSDRCLASGAVRIDDIVETLAWDDSKISAETLGGLLSEIHGGIPRQGSVLEFQGWTLSVRRSSRKRVKEVLLERMEPRKNSPKP